MINNERKKTLIQFVKFGIVGVSNTAIGLGTYYLFLHLGFHYMVANVLSWLISVFNAFYWNNKYVFKSAASWTMALIKTYVSYGFSFGVGCVVLAILVEILGISAKIAPLLVLVITIPLNFVLNKFWAFK